MIKWNTLKYVRIFQKIKYAYDACAKRAQIVRVIIVFSVNAGNVTQNNVWSLTDSETEKKTEAKTCLFEQIVIK